MGNQNINIQFKVNDDGSLALTTKGIEKLTQSTKKATTATDNFSKTSKGVGHATNNNTKSFSKQAQSINSGLVPAYAALAANVFAVSAAFGALKRAAALTQLSAGLDAVGNAAGANLPQLAESLKKITGYAISTREAFEAVALGTSAGFSSTQIEGLAKVAKGASLALGRDLGDAMSRLTHGAAKLEPELLDELGIMVRLDTATKGYADSVHKNVKELTQFERRMAFTNAIIEQGTTKFAAIAEAVEVNPYDKLSASFDNLAKSFFNLMNIGFSPLISFLGGSNSGLIGVMLLLGSTVTKQMVPGMYEAAKAASEEADAMKKATLANNKSMEAIKGYAPKYGELVDKFKSGTASVAEQTSGMKSLTASIKYQKAALDRLSINKNSDEYKAQAKVLGRITLERKLLVNSINAENAAEAAAHKANTLEAASKLELTKITKFYSLAVSESNSVIRANSVALGVQSKTLLAAKIAWNTAAISVKTFGTAILAALPYIGLAVTAVGLLKSAFDWLTEDTAINKLTDEIVEGFSKINEVATSLNTTISGLTSSTDTYIAKLKASSGVLTQFAAAIKKVNDEAYKNKFKEYAETKHSQLDLIPLLTKAEKDFADNIIKENKVLDINTRTRISNNAALERYINIGRKAQSIQNDLKNTSLESAKAIVKVSEGYLITASTMEGTEAYKSIIADITESKKRLQELIKGGITGVEAKEVNELVKHLEVVNNELSIQESITKDLINTTDSLGNSISKAFGHASSPIDKYVTAIASAQDKIKALSQDSYNAIKTSIDPDIMGLAIKALKQSGQEIEGQLPTLDQLKSSLLGVKDHAERVNIAYKQAGIESKKLALVANDLKKAAALSYKGVAPYYEAVNNSIKAQITAQKDMIALLQDAPEAEALVITLKQKQLSLENKLISATKIHKREIAVLAKEYSAPINAAKAMQKEAKALKKAMYLDSDNVVTYYNKLNTGIKAEITAEKEHLTILKNIKGSIAEQEKLKARIAALNKKLAEPSKIMFEASKASIRLQQTELKLKSDALAVDKTRTEFINSLLAEEVALSKELGVNAYNTSATLETEKAIILSKMDLLKQELSVSKETLFIQKSKTLAELNYQKAKAVESDNKLAVSNINEQVASVESTYKQAISNMDSATQKSLAGMADSLHELDVKEFTSSVSSAIKDLGDAFSDDGLGDILAGTFDSAVEASLNYYKLQEKLQADYKQGIITSDQLEEKSFQSKIALATNYASTAGAALNSLADAQDQTSKSGFESAKKYQMAAAIINTAAAVTNALATVTPFPAALVAAAVAAASGIAQISKIKSTSFGDSSGSVSSPPTSISGGGTGGYAQTTGTVLGDTTKASESMSKTNELLEAIHAKEYRELRSIAYSMEDLNKNITGLVNSIIRDISKGGLGTAEGIKYGYTADKQLDVFLGDMADKLDSVFNGNTFLEAVTGFVNIGTSFITRGLSSVIGGGTEWKHKGEGYVINPLYDEGRYRTGKNPTLNDPFLAGEILDGVNLLVSSYSYDEKHKRGSLGGHGSSKYYTTLVEAEDSVSKYFNDALGNITNIVIGLTKELGTDLDVEFAKTFAFDIGKIDLRGLDSEEMNKKLGEIFSTQLDLFTEYALGTIIGEFQNANEGLMETAARLFAQKTLVIDNFTKLGKEYNEAEQALMDSPGGILKLTDAIAQAAGGVEKYQKTFDSFFDQFFTDIEKQSFASKNLNGIFEDMGMSLPATRKGYRDLTAAVDVSTESGQAAYIQLIKLTDQAGAYYDYLEDQEQSLFDLRTGVLDEMGQTYASEALKRERELKDMDPVLKLMQEELWARQDANVTRELSLQIMDLEGKSLAATTYRRERELLALSASDQVLQKRIWALQDEKDAVTDAQDSLSKAQEELKKAFAAHAEDLQKAHEGVLDSLKDRLSDITDNVNSLTSALSSIVNARRAMEVITRSTILSSTMAINSMTAQVSSGNYSDMDDLDYHLGVLTSDNSDQYSQFEEYQRDFLKAKVSISRLERATGHQLTAEEQQVKLLEQQIDIENDNYDAAIAANEAQLNALLGINESVLTIPEAIANLNAAISALASANAVVQKSSSTTSISDQQVIYNTVESMRGAYSDQESLNQAVYAAAVSARVPSYMLDDTYGMAAGTSAAWAASHGLPAFAEGGTFNGGWRLVGEEGPELEYTGKSQILSNTQSKNLMDTSALEAEIRKLREDINAAQYQIAKNTGESTKLLNRWDGDGIPEERDVA